MSNPTMQSPGSVQSPGAAQPDSSFFGKINLFAAPPNANTRTPITSNDAFRFQVGVNYKAKIIGVEDVEEARGDRMCQIAIQKQKAFIKATGAHKQKININVSLEGIKLVDQMTGATLHHHPVQRISFISRDVSDARAFGYIYGAGDGKHKFFGIKTEKAAENVVLTLRDLFQVVFEMKKKESEDEKKLKLENKEMTQPDKSTNESQQQAQNADVPATPEKEPEPAPTSGLMELESEMINLGFGQASQPSDFDPLTSGGGAGASLTFSAAPPTQNAFSQGFGGDPFAANMSAVQPPTSLPFSPPASNPMGQQTVMGQQPMGQQNAWATFSPAGNAPAARFPQQQQPPMAGGGGFGAPSPFGAPTQQPMGTSNPFGGGFGAAAAPQGGGGFGGPSAFGGDPFGGSGGGSLLAPSVNEQPKEPEPPQPPKRENMFSNLVDNFGVDFSAKKETAPPPKMNEMAMAKSMSQQQQQVFGNTVSEFNNQCSFEGGFGDSDPFDTSSVQQPHEIKAQEMETAPNVYTKQISFSESDNDLTPDRDIPAPSLPPPPLPSSVHSSNSTLHYPVSAGPTPPPRPGSSQQSTHSNNTPPLPQRNNQDHHSHSGSPMGTPPLVHAQTVDLGMFPDSPPPPPPPRPGSKLAGTAALGRQTVSYSAVPRPHPSPKLRHSPGIGPDSPTLRHNTAHRSPLLQRQITAPALGGPPNRSPQLGRQVRYHSESNPSSKFTPPSNRKQEFFPSAQALAAPTEAKVAANFADFSNFSQQISSSSTDWSESPPPPPPPRQGSGRQKAPKLSMESRSMTMPAPKGNAEFNEHGSVDRANGVHDHHSESKIPGVTQSQATKPNVSEPDPFALTLPNPKKGRNVDYAYARPRPKARSKTPTLISTKVKSKSKSNISTARRSDSPLSQNSVSSREYEASECGNSAAAKTTGYSLTQKERNACDSVSPKETRLSSSHMQHQTSHPHRTGTPVSMHSMQSASSGQSGQSSEHAVDPFAHVDPFETKDTADPFDHKDPFVGPDPFKSPVDPFSKDLSDTEFKTKAIAITADGLEVSEESTSPIVNGGSAGLTPDPNPFGSDPFSMVKDPFHDKTKLKLDQPLLGGMGKGMEKSFDPFDTAHVAGTLTKPAVLPEFSNNCDSGIGGFQTHISGSQDLFKDFAQGQIMGSSSEKPVINENNQKQSQDAWAADFNKDREHTDKFTSITNHQTILNDVASQYSQTSSSPSQIPHSDPISFNHHNIHQQQPPQNHDQIIHSASHSNSPANHPGSHGYPSRERHESDSTSYNSEISEAFATTGTVTSPSVTNQNATVVNGRNTPSNPFLTNDSSTPAQTPAASNPLPTSGSLLDF